MLTVKELAKQSGISPDVVRYYVRIGLIEPIQRQENGYRVFSLRNIKLLKFVRSAKNLGFTLSEIKKITKQAEHGESPCSEVRSIIRDRILENRAKLEAMLALQHRMERALEQWSTMPDSRPNGNSVCSLVETFDSPLVDDKSDLIFHQFGKAGENYDH